MTLALRRSDEPVSRETDWLTMREAPLQMRPYSFPHPQVAVAVFVEEAAVSRDAVSGSGLGGPIAKAVMEAVING